MPIEQREKHGEIVVYELKKGGIGLGVKLEEDDIWLTQQQMAKLFDTTKQNIGQHLTHVYSEGELEEMATVKDSFTVQIEGDREIKRKISYFNLDAVISVGYRIKSKTATRFRIWATKVIKDHIVKGFTYRPDRLKELEGRVDSMRDTYEATRKLIRKVLTHSASKEAVDKALKEIEQTKADLKELKRNMDILSGHH